MTQYSREEALDILSKEEDPETREFLRASMDCSFDKKYLRLFNRDQMFLQKLLLFMAVSDGFDIPVISEMFRSRSLESILLFREKKLHEKYGDAQKHKIDKTESSKELSSKSEKRLQQERHQIQQMLELFQRQMDAWNEQTMDAEVLHRELQEIKRERDELAEQLKNRNCIPSEERNSTEQRSIILAFVERILNARRERMRRREENARRNYYILLLSNPDLPTFAVDVLDAAFSEGFSVEEMKSLPLLSATEHEIKEAFDNSRYRRERLRRVEQAEASRVNTYRKNNL